MLYLRSEQPLLCQAVVGQTYHIVVLYLRSEQPLLCQAVVGQTYHIVVLYLRSEQPLLCQAVVGQTYHIIVLYLRSEQPLLCQAVVGQTYHIVVLYLRSEQPLLCQAVVGQTYHIVVLYLRSEQPLLFQAVVGHTYHTVVLYLRSEQPLLCQAVVGLQRDGVHGAARYLVLDGLGQQVQRRRQTITDVAEIGGSIIVMSMARLEICILFCLKQFLNASSNKQKHANISFKSLWFFSIGTSKLLQKQFWRYCLQLEPGQSNASIPPDCESDAEQQLGRPIVEAAFRSCDGNGALVNNW